MTTIDLQWWGYIHANGSPQVKRWFGDQRDIDDAMDSDFVEEVHGPFTAVDRVQALRKLRSLAK